ncbi:hypothetical protein HMPREF3052_06950 [Neisseria sp. HMSC056A03]|uniref:hypothetical protein n=1 Tax=Neisseria sp. HMSC056A03 TaxID=1739544 RepID=UPI0008A3D50E|nr:hypothetical protein [Neisseria sp. HMSC056A03]OFO27838.1 hypothetical protein HMPREF3052_06950 [Neisseria sp. HMSC056A03]
MDDVVHFEAVFSKFTASSKFKYIKIKYLFSFTSKSDAGVAFESFPLAGKIHLKDGKSNVQMCRQRHIWADYPMSGNLYVIRQSKRTPASVLHL